MGADLYRKSANPEIRAERDALMGQYDGIRDMPEGDEQRAAFRAWDDACYGPDWYFRDSYNSTSLFWMLGLSWWQDLDQFLGPAGDGVMEQVTDEDGETYDDYSLHPAGMRRLAELVRSREATMEASMQAKSLPDRVPDDDRYTLDRAWYRGQFVRLLTFLETCADAGDTIRCSV